ncbi:sulfotransferase family 2 domain-containing protein [Profundibacter amoris]|uniref:Type II secretory pathway, pullulanase PulA n=1 Tax=Profundibacter amoris TaxID=2171755 RepID=A0A347UIN3_9RHOB|nr:sulfotransferase family 2 domain-containing protein [Profundibacter amoris]AXX98711.1 Type II secretory pathway, pullulanase PulA [Profundibacter amoris]
MIISHGRKYIFVHIPKTGGTALSLALEGRVKKNDILIGDTPKAVQRRRRLKGVQTSGRLWKHSRLADIYGLVTQDQIEEYFTFTLVRNPWDRLVSYYHWLRGQTFDHPAVGLAQRLDFSGFLNDEHTRRTVRTGSYRQFMYDKAGMERCDLYIRLEHLQQDLAPLEQHLGFSLGWIPVVNSSSRDADYRRYYSDADARMVAEICAGDIARFGYVF